MIGKQVSWASRWKYSRKQIYKHQAYKVNVNWSVFWSIIRYIITPSNFLQLISLKNWQFFFFPPNLLILLLFVVLYVIFEQQEDFCYDFGDSTSSHHALTGLIVALHLWGQCLFTLSVPSMLLIRELRRQSKTK